jgi:hypothetical protein
MPKQANPKVEYKVQKLFRLSVEDVANLRKIVDSGEARDETDAARIALKEKADSIKI